MVLMWLACWHLVRWLGARSLVGVAVLLTPMAVFCLGILNTSAVEILGAAGMAAVVAVYARRPESLAHTATQAVVLVSGTALVLSRQLGIVTMAVLTAVLLLLGGWRDVWAGLRERRPVTWAAVLVPALSTVAVVVWELRYDHPVLLGPWLSIDSFRGFREQWMQLIQESVGWFGWLDVRPPYAVNLVWFAAAVALVVTALVLGDRRDRVVLLGMLLVVLLVCYVTYSRVFFPINAGLQGRHVLPIVALVPIWSGVVVAERLQRRAFAVAVRIAAVLLPLVVLVGLYLNAKRYAVGLDVRSRVVRPRRPVVAAAGLVPLAGARRSVAASLLGVAWVRVLGRKSGSAQGRPGDVTDTRGGDRAGNLRRMTTVDEITRVATASNGRRWPWQLLRVVTALTTLSAFTQAVLAGGVVAGRIEMLPLHSNNGLLLTVGTLALLVALVLAWRPGGGPAWILLVGLR